MTQEFGIDRLRQDQLLFALGEQLASTRDSAHLVVVGGSALLALGLVERVTRDIDVVAIDEGGTLLPADPFPHAIIEARDRVARDFGLPESWLNPGPGTADFLRLGLPDGFLTRVVTNEYGPALHVSFASRIDQIHLKLYAVVDQGSGRHEADLRALGPTEDELLRAARWTRRHDPSPGFLHVLRQVLSELGIEDADVDP